MQNIENAIPVQFIADNFSLKRNAPSTNDKQTIDKLFMPNTNELSIPDLFNALIKK